MNEAVPEDDDRLPWLETVDHEEEERGSGAVRVIFLVLLGLAIIAAAIFGWWWFQNRPGAGGSGALIEAEPGPYKERPGDTGGMKVAGDGDTRFVTSDGGISNGSVDVDAIPEEPVAGKQAPKAAAKDSGKPGTGAAKVVAEVPQTADKVAAKPSDTRKTAATAGGGGGSVVQLGSFPTKSRADAAWKALSQRFSYLAPLGQAVQKADVNGSTVYRLRVNAGSAGQAKEICGKLKIAGEDCYIP